MQKLLLCLILAGFLFQSCNSDDKSVKPVDSNDSLSQSKVNLPPLKDTMAIQLDSTGAEIFASFLDKFNKDSLFQVSRVKFPFSFKTHYCGENVKVRKVTAEKWEMYSLVYVDSFATMKEFPFKQKIKRSKNKVEVIWHAVEGDYMHDTNTFLLIDNKWFFVEYMELGC